MPYETAKEMFDNAIFERKNEFPLQITVDPKSEIYKVFYKISNRKGDIYENYCLLAEFKEKGENLTEIEYAFVYDKLMANYTRFLSLLCVVAPILSTLLAYYRFNFTNFWLYIPVGLICIFGIVTLFFFKEKKENAAAVVSEFEKMLSKVFAE